MELVIVASFLLIGLVCGFYVSILGFLAIICIWFAVISSAIYAGFLAADVSFFGVVVAMAVAQVGFLVSAVISSKLRALKLKLTGSDCARSVEPNGKNVL